MSEAKTYETAGKCPHCGYGFEAATALSGGKGPSNGAVSLCIGCGEWMVFKSKDPNKWRKPTDKEYLEIASDPLCIKARAAWAETMAAKKRADEKTINVFPPIGDDFQASLKHWTEGEPAEYDLALSQTFFYLGALCVLIRAQSLKGGYADFMLALRAWDRECREYLETIRHKPTTMMLERAYLREICRIGQGADCCRYLIGDDTGLHCAKHAPELASQLDERVRLETIHARGDNCPGKPFEEIL